MVDVEKKQLVALMCDEISVNVDSSTAISSSNDSFMTGSAGSAEEL